MAGAEGTTPLVVGWHINILRDTYSDTTNVKYTLSCTRPVKIIANGVGEPHLGAAGHRKWPKTWEDPRTLSVVENGQSVVCKLIPQTRRRLGLATLGFGRPWLVRGSSVVGIGLCTLDLHWVPLARAIVLRLLDRRLWAGTGVTVGGQLACCSHCTQRSGASHCACALSSLSCVFVFSS